MANKKRIPHKFLPWIAARKQHRLSHGHVQMARELGMDPKRLRSPAKPANTPGRLPLDQYIEKLYFERFGKTQPDEICSIEQLAADHLARREAKKIAKQQAEDGQPQ